MTSNLVSNVLVVGEKEVRVLLDMTRYVSMLLNCTLEL